MKNSLLFLLIPTLLFSVTGCNKSTTSGKVFLEFGKVHTSESSFVDEIDYDTLTSWINHKDSFVLAVSNEGCSCWEGFQPILASFNYKYNLDIKQIPVKELNIEGRNKYGMYTVAVDSPFLAFFSNGALTRQAMYGGNKEYSKVFTDKTGVELEKFFFENAYLPKMLYIERETLDGYISNNKEFNLYVARTGCGDCQTVNETILRDWNKTTLSVNEPLYVFDLAPYYQTEEYQSIKDTYGLSETYNTDLGYSTGMVPTFQRRKGSKVKDMAVVLNDSLYEDGATMKSYFTSARVSKMAFLKDTGIEYVLDGKVLSADQIDEVEYHGIVYRMIKRDALVSMHTPILNRFLNTYVK